MKKILCIILSLIMMLLAVLPAFAEAEIVQTQTENVQIAESTAPEDEAIEQADDITPEIISDSITSDVDVIEEVPDVGTGETTESDEIYVLSDEEAQLALASGNVTTLEVVDTPATDGEYVALGEIDIHDVQESNVISRSFNATAKADFTTYGEVISGKVVNIGGTNINVGSTPKTAYDALTADIEKGVDSTIFQGAGGDGNSLKCVTFVNPGVDSASLAKYIAILAYYALDWDNPSMFYSSGYVSFGYSISGDKITLYIRPMARYELADYNTRVSIKNQLETKVNEIVEEANSACTTNLEKIAYFNKWLCENNSYNYNAASSGTAYGSVYPWSSASALLSSSSSSVKEGPVCEGYSRAMQTLCQAVDIPCILLTGDNHMWNNIKLNGKWYGNDTTWSDGGDITSYLLTTNLNNSSGHTVQGVNGVTFDYPLLESSTALSEIGLVASKLRLSVGGNDTLTPVFLPGNTGNSKTITWSTSDLSVATVVNGVVTGNAIGSCIITATSSNGQTTTCNVTVTNERVLSYIFVSTMPTKSSYYVGDAFNPEGMIVKAKYSDNSTENVTGYTITPTALTENTTYVTIGYGGQTTKCGVTVVKPILTSISVDTKPTKTSYNVGDTFNPAGMVITAKYNNDTTKTVTDYTVTPTTLTAGTTYVTISYGGKTATCSVTVKEPETGIPAFVERLYTTALGRESEAEGKAKWVEYLKAGKATGAEAGKAFMLGQEFENRKLSNEDFLNVVYQTYFGRNPDEGGYNAWLNFLNNGYSREGVICAFAVSKEFQGICDSYGMQRGTITSTQNRDKNATLTSFVNRIYTKLLDRAAEPDGLNAWTGAILKGDFTVKQTAVIFVESQEFLAHNYSTEDYVTHLYRMFFGREPEAAGCKNWVNYINAGKCTRTQAAEAFADSKEFAAIMKDAGV